MECSVDKILLLKRVAMAFMTSLLLFFWGGGGVHVCACVCVIKHIAPFLIFYHC